MKLFVVFFSFSLLTLLFFAPLGHSQSAAKIKSDDELVREEMIEMSRQLSVTCTECHRVDNFMDDKKPHFKIAKDHMEIVRLLKTKGFNGKDGPLANCYMCHQGALKPAYKENMKVVAVKAEAPKKEQVKPDARPAK